MIIHHEKKNKLSSPFPQSQYTKSRMYLQYSARTDIQWIWHFGKLCPWFNILLAKQALPPVRLSHRCPKHTDTHMVFGNAFELKNVESRHPRFVNIPITSAFHNLRQLEADRLFNIYETWDVFRTGWLSLQMKKLNYSTSFIAVSLSRCSLLPETQKPAGIRWCFDQSILPEKFNRTGP